ncbi:MAG: type II toxin-antitoxin system VapC family toxin [Acidobacteria bacterium]|nr:type II toxin-antitoxin system VapC family toxin [Acidobacteriota bacterium]
MAEAAVVDASALLALLGQEPGWEVVAKSIPGAFVSAVNLAEVASKLAEHGMPEDEIRQALGGLGLEVVAFGEEMAIAAGVLRPRTKSAGLSLGDRACLALAYELKLPAYTTDQAWSELRLGIDIRLVRPGRRHR